MAGGPFRWFNAALDKTDLLDTLPTGTFKAVLCGAAQAIDPTFVGASGDCRYADLTAELATAGGYTAGGLSLSNIVFSRVANVVSWTADPLIWALSSAITYKYLIIYADNANDDLLCFMDANTASGVATSSPVAGSFEVTPNASGIVGWST